LKNLKVDELEDLKQSAMRQKLQADLQLREEVDRNWEEVYTNEHMFNRRQIEVSNQEKIIQLKFIKQTNCSIT
jgi:secreted Zn-dependent insulinase-like peptidase